MNKEESLELLLTEDNELSIEQYRQKLELKRGLFELLAKNYPDKTEDVLREIFSQMTPEEAAQEAYGSDKAGETSEDADES